MMEVLVLLVPKFYYLWRARSKDNIIHLVLARTPNAPWYKGYKFILVPKFLPNESGDFVDRNKVEWINRKENGYSC